MKNVTSAPNELNVPVAGFVANRFWEDIGANR